MSVSGVALDSSGNVYVAHSLGGQVVKEAVQPNGSFIQSVVSNAGLTSPGSVAVDAAGNVSVADANDGKVFKETISGGTYTQSLVVNNDNGSVAGIAVDAGGDVYLADSSGAPGFQVLTTALRAISVLALESPSGFSF